MAVRRALIMRWKWGRKKGRKKAKEL